MTFDTTHLERDCVLLNCSRPAQPGSVYCAKDDPNPPAPPPSAGGADPDTMWPDNVPSPPPVPDLTTMEPVWDGTQFVLRPKQPVRTADLDTIRDIVRQLMAELGIPEAR